MLTEEQNAGLSQCFMDGRRPAPLWAVTEATPQARSVAGRVLVATRVPEA